MKKLDGKSISCFSLALLILLTGCQGKSNDEKKSPDKISFDVTDSNVLNNKFEELVPEFDGPSFMIGEPNFEKVENEDFDAQVNFCNDIININNAEYALKFFAVRYDRDKFYLEHTELCNQLSFLIANSSVDKIVEELNNLYVMSQTPSCLPDPAWEFYFGTLDSLKELETDGLYDTYISLAELVHNSSIRKHKELKLTITNDKV